MKPTGRMLEQLSPDVVYDIDSRDTIIMVNDAWSVFAAKNDGVSLLPPGINGRSLWEFVKDPTTRIVYSRLFDRVRAGAGASTFEFRCDSPSVKRFLQMEIAASGTGMLRCTVRTLGLEPRPYAAILDPEAGRSDHLMIICSWCKRVSDGDGAWVEIDEAPVLYRVFAEELPPSVSHGMCDDCYSSMMRTLDEESDIGSAEHPAA